MTLSLTTYTKLAKPGDTVTIYLVHPDEFDQGIKAIWKKSPTVERQLQSLQTGDSLALIDGESRLVHEFATSRNGDWVYVAIWNQAPRKGKRGCGTNKPGKELKHGIPTRMARIPINITPELVDAFGSIQATIDDYRAKAQKHKGEPRYDQLSKLLEELEALGL